MVAARQPNLTAEQSATIARALADPRRFSILQEIAATDTLACSALKAQADISPATISHHLRELTEAGLIDITREGRVANLSLRRETWDAYVEFLQQL